MRQRHSPACNRLGMCLLHLRQIMHKQKLREMIVDAGALQMLAGAEIFVLCKGGASHGLMDGRSRRPGPTPLGPRRNRGCDVLKIRKRHAVGDEALRPMGNGRGEESVRTE